MTAEHLERFAELLNSPDPEDLPARGFVVTQPMDDPRRKRTVWMTLAVKWDAIRRFEQDEQERTNAFHARGQGNR